MPKGLFSQGVVVLFGKRPSDRAIERALEGFSILKRTAAAKEWLASTRDLGQCATL